MGRLTAKGIAKLSRPGRYTVGETLTVVVKPSGARSWVQRLVVDGIRRDIGLGSLKYVTLQEAKDRAYANRMAARRGGNPLVASRAESRAPTFRQASEAVEKANRARWAESSRKSRASMLEQHVYPKLGSRRVDQVTRADVLRVLSPVWTAKPALARRLRVYVTGILAWAVAHSHCETNPATGISAALPAQPTNGADHHRSLPFQDVPAALRKIAACGASESARACLAFVVLTAVRAGEARGAKWSEIDTAAKVWTVPASRMKAGREHRVPLSDQAIAVLESVRHLRRSSDYIFASPTPGVGMVSPATMGNTLASAGLRDRCTVHGFRASFRTWAGEQTDADHAVMELCLAHTVGSEVERAYARSTLLGKRRALMRQWAAFATAA